MVYPTDEIDALQMDFVYFFICRGDDGEKERV